MAEGKKGFFGRLVEGPIQQQNNSRLEEVIKNL